MIEKDMRKWLSPKFGFWSGSQHIVIFDFGLFSTFLYLILPLRRTVLAACICNEHVQPLWQ